jgi:hypothetical protein
MHKLKNKKRKRKITYIYPHSGIDHQSIGFGPFGLGSSPNVQEAHIDLVLLLKNYKSSMWPMQVSNLRPSRY